MNNLLTPTQDVILFFKLRFSCIPTSDITIKVELVPEFSQKLEEKKLLPGARFSALDRKAMFKFTVPEGILKGGLKRKSIPSLGNFRLYQRGRQIHYEDFIGFLVVDNNTYFEKRIVPKIFQDMGYITEVIGGKNEPDTIAFHRIINPSEKTDLESTLTSDYDIARWDHDCSKFSRYKQIRRLTRLLIVTRSNTISRDVLRQLNQTRDPISLIEFKDLKSIHCNFKRDGDHASVVSKLSSSGKIVVPNSLSEVKVFLAKQINISRTI